MAAYNSVEVAGNYPISGVGLGGRTYHSARGEFTTTAALGAGDVIQMFDLPPRARVWGGFIKAAQLDSNGAPTITLSLGTVATPGLFFNASTVAGRTAGVTADSAMQATGRDYITPGARTRVIMTVPAGAATGVVGAQIVAHIQYSVEEPI